MTVRPKIFKLRKKNQLLKIPAPIVFELQGSYWYQKKRNFVLYKVVEFFFSIFDVSKNLRPPEVEIFEQKKFQILKNITLTVFELQD